MERIDGYAPIGAYAAIGDGRTVALVALDGSIDFCSLPVHHAPTTFAALLDPERGGRFALTPVAPFEAERRYLERTNVLETTFRTRAGAVRVTDALTMHEGALLPWVELVRRVEGVEGSVRLGWSVEPRFDWGREEAELTTIGGVPVARGSGLELAVHAWDAGEPALGEDAVTGEFTAEAGSRAVLALVCTHDQPLPVPEREDVDARLDATAEWWRRWLDGWHYDGPWPEVVARSALALKLLVHSPHGSIAAAPTTSLPEKIGGDANFDYRYAWVRDSAFTLDALMRLGLPEQVHASFSWLLAAVRETAPDLRPFYALDGGVPTRTEELDHLRGYRDSKPVRYGNAANVQLQIGSWGDLLETAELYVREGNALDVSTGKLLSDCVDRLCTVWRDADSGMWELDDHQHYTVSKLSAWTAFDRVLQLVDGGHVPGDHAGTWLEQRDAVREFIEERCWSEERGAYVSYPGTTDLDAGVLRAARMGFVDPAGERFQRTIEAVREDLGAGGPFLYRLSDHRSKEGAFLACSFWLVEALARGGRVDEAEAVMDELLGSANDVGLFSEEIDPASGELLGNFPQGLTHLALVGAAGAVADARG